MLDILKDNYLMLYFGLEYFLKNFINKEKIRSTLNKIFHLNNDEITQIDNLLNYESLDETDSVESYHLSLRLLEYYKKVGIPFNISNEELSMIILKGTTLEKLINISNVLGSNYNHGNIYEVATMLKGNKNIFQWNILSIMLCEGWVVDKNVKQGLKYAYKCAKWNDLKGMLIYLSYGEKNRKVLKMLNTIANINFNKFDISHILKDLDIQEDIGYLEETKILKEYFENFNEEKDKYVPSVAKVLYSSFASLEDRKRIILNNQAEQMVNVHNLPFETEDAYRPKISLFKNNLSKKRDKVNDEIVSFLNQNKTNTLLLNIEDLFIKEEYLKSFKESYKDIPLFYIDAKNLIKMDLVPTKQHFVVANLIQSRKPYGVFIIDNIEKLNDELFEDLNNLLNPKYINKFNLKDENININLSNISFILISNDKQYCALNSNVKVINIEETFKEEKDLMVDYIINHKSNQYECSNLKFAENVKDNLTKLSAKECYFTLDLVCRKRAYENAPQIITEDEIKNNIKENYKAPLFGFVVKGEK